METRTPGGQKPILKGPAGGKGGAARQLGHPPSHQVAREAS